MFAHTFYLTFVHDYVKKRAFRVSFDSILNKQLYWRAVKIIHTVKKQS